MMAESDAAGPGTPGGPKARAITREDVDRLLAQAEREWESLTPEERARREAESDKADREAYEAALKAARPTIEALERAAKSAERSAAGSVWPKPATFWEEAPEIGPAGPIDQSIFTSLMEGIEPARPLSAEEIRAAVADGVREAMTERDRKPEPDSNSPPSPPPAGLFTGGVAWAAGQKALLVGRILRELEGFPTQPPPPAPREQPPSTALSSEEICAAVQDAAAEGVKKGLAESKKDRKPRGDSTCDRLRDLHLNIDPEFAENAPLRKLAKRIERSTGALDGSHYYQTKLKPIRAENRARKRKVNGAQKWGDFNSIGRLDEADEDH